MSVKILRQCLNKFCWQSAHELLTIAEHIQENDEGNIPDAVDPLEFKNKLKITLRRMVISGTIERMAVTRQDATGRSIRPSFLYKLFSKKDAPRPVARIPQSHYRLMALIKETDRPRISSGHISRQFWLDGNNLTFF